MSSMSDAERLAETLRAAYALGLDEGFAAAAPSVGLVVELVHEPPHPADGPKPGPELAALWEQEGAMLRKSMPDAQITDLVIKAGDGEVQLRAVLRGTAPDGAVLAHPYNVTYDLTDGKVVRAFAAYDPAPVAGLNRKAFGESSPS
jgi:hypothetical protein